MTKTIAVTKTPEGVTALAEAPLFKLPDVLPPVDKTYAAHIAREVLRVLDTVQPKTEKAYSADFGAQIPAYQEGKPIQRQDMRRSGKTADDMIKFRRMAERFAAVCVALAESK